MAAYTFDLMLRASATIEAASEDEARALVFAAADDCGMATIRNDGNAEITAEVSLDSELVLGMVDGVDAPGATEPWIDQTDARAAVQFIRRIADYAPYCWRCDDGFDDDQSGDAIQTVNDLIVEARKLVHLEPLPDDKIGEQEDEEA